MSDEGILLRERMREIRERNLARRGDREETEIVRSHMRRNDQGSSFRIEINGEHVP